ncbi:hypothetical protein SAMN05443668_101207 [Cryptosporangium aurantiacum]|uniref:Uncharacterized protein n=1 Tax=Cryptosporangium aurantiacum TaxID=134849 RepID=A0A1M7HJH9_9ACTN|nr:hypothetical protein SAMN05443668_101207 [Cryptosporangium aurantiacum]
MSFKQVPVPQSKKRKTVTKPVKKTRKPAAAPSPR